MGKIADVLREMKPQYDFILETIPKLYIYRLENAAKEAVFESFKALRPLSHDFKPVKLIEESSYGSYTWRTWLYVGEWVRRKGEREERGSSIDGTDDFFNAIRRYGDDLKRHVRRPIAEDFSRLLDLTKKLTLYSTHTVELKIPEMKVIACDYRTYIEYQVEFEELIINKLCIDLHSPSDIAIMKDDKQVKRIDLHSKHHITVIEDIIHYIVELLKKALEEVEKVKAHNDAIIAEMKTIVAPYTIANAIKNHKR